LDYSSYAPIYDGEYADYNDDAAFFVKWAKRCPTPALELGCGTGRVLFALARAGCPVVGLETCQAMLDQAVKQLSQAPPEVAAKVTLHKGDMRDFELAQEFGLIYLPFREFMHLETVQEQLDCLDAIHRHLLPEGRLIINLYNMDLVALALQQSSDTPLYRQKNGDYKDPKNGQQVLLSSASYYRAESQMLEEERYYDRIDSEGLVIERRIVQLRQRWFFQYEMEHLLERASFKIESILGGFRGQTLRPGGEMIFIARPAFSAELRQELAWLSNKLARLEG